MTLPIKTVVKKLIPSPLEVGREAIIVLGGIVIAAWVISRYPALKKFVSDSSITVKDQAGKVLF
jgi:hypothetical protein